MRRSVASAPAFRKARSELELGLDPGGLFAE
jgi:hypothetical protein